MNRSRTEERTEREQRENAKINCQRTVRTKHERSPRKTKFTQDEAKRKP